MRTIAVSGVGVPLLSAEARSAQIERDIAQMEGPPVEGVERRENVMVEMRDGTSLATDIYLPDLPGRSGQSQGRPGQGFPTIVVRTPYSKAGYISAGEFFAGQGFAVVAQDVRGKFESEGEFYPYRIKKDGETTGEGVDGYDTVEWAADQPWSNGRVGTFGISYMAATQWAAAGAEAEDWEEGDPEAPPPSLEAMAPGFAAASYYAQGAYTGGGCLISHNIDYLNGFAREELAVDQPETADEVTVLDKAQEAMPQLYWDLPVTPFEPHQAVQDEYDVDVPWLRDWHTHETYGDYWAVQDATGTYAEVDVPVLNYGGWYDIFGQGTVWNYQGMREEGSGNAPDQTELVMGPYTHGNIAQGQGQVMGYPYRFPSNVTYNEQELLLNWFRRHLTDDGDEPQPVRIYVPGLDEWVGASEFPLPETDYRTYYLHSDGAANASAIDDQNLDYEGELTADPPGDEPVDEYTYDPEDPVVTIGGYNIHWTGGVADRSTAYHDREDILVYETERLEDDVAVVGPITVTLYASTSQPDTDFVTVLSDVDPGSGTGGLWVAEGARRGRIGDVEADPRDQSNYAEMTELTPGEVYEWKIAVWPTARVFEAGHRIRLDISSSNFPRYDRNLNTGGGLDTSETATADQTIYHDREHPSQVELPIVPVDELKDDVIDGPVP
jgi:putative CocE/NonD family hydrolase